MLVTTMPHAVTQWAPTPVTVSWDTAETDSTAHVNFHITESSFAINLLHKNWNWAIFTPLIRTSQKEDTSEIRTPH